MIEIRDSSLREEVLKNKKIVLSPELEGGRAIPIAVDMKSRIDDFTRVISAHPELAETILGNIDYSKGMFSTGAEFEQGRAVRYFLDSFKDQPDKLSIILQNMPVMENLGFNPKVFQQVYFDNNFQKQTEGLDFANKFSVALTTQRFLERSGKSVNAENIQETVNFITTQRARFADYKILDEKTTYLPITHEEEMFDNAKMVAHARATGVQNIPEQNLKGKESKDKFLSLIEQSSSQGKTTVHFNNHGGPNHQWLSSGQAGKESSDELHRPDAISYVELGDTLAERGKLGEVTMIIDSCYSKDFTDNLYHYLHTVKGVTGMPVVITETNRGQVGLSNVFDRALNKVIQSGKPLTGSDIYKIESETFTDQDLSITLPPMTEGDITFTNPRFPGIDLGSTNDAGAAEAPRKPTGKPDDKKPAELPPTVIEIAENEQEMEEKLAVG